MIGSRACIGQTAIFSVIGAPILSWLQKRKGKNRLKFCSGQQGGTLERAFGKTVHDQNRNYVDQGASLTYLFVGKL